MIFGGTSGGGFGRGCPPPKYKGGLGAKPPKKKNIFSAKWCHENDILVHIVPEYDAVGSSLISDTRAMDRRTETRGYRFEFSSHGSDGKYSTTRFVID